MNNSFLTLASLITLLLAGCEDMSYLRAHHEYPGAYIVTLASYSEWMVEVKRIALQRDDAINGDEVYFRGYYRKGYDPLEAIWHWENDSWPSMGGGA